MKRGEISTGVAGIDAAKLKLDVAVHGLEDEVCVDNKLEGFARLEDWLRARKVSRVGIEASGGYERAVVASLRERGFEVVVHQPSEVKAYARFRRIRAKNDRIDARLIAEATAHVETVRAACDPKITELCERLTAYDQAAEMVAQIKTFLEHVTQEDLKAQYQAQLATLKAWKAKLTKDLIVRIKAHPDLARRFDLLLSLPGFGPIVAATFVLRMPELGGMARGQPACLLGVAPFDRDSGASKGQRQIFGGRARARRMAYLAALAAKRCDNGLKAFATRLLAAGKKPKVVIVAVMRKLAEAANIVLTRGTPWVPA